MATIIISAACVLLIGAVILYMQGMLECIFCKDYRNSVDYKLGKLIEEFDDLLSDTETGVEKQERRKRQGEAAVLAYRAKQDAKKRDFDEWRQRDLLKSVGLKTKTQCMIDDMDKWMNTKTVSDWKAVAMQSATKEFFGKELY